MIAELPSGGIGAELLGAAPCQWAPRFLAPCPWPPTMSKPRCSHLRGAASFCRAFAVASADTDAAADRPRAVAARGGAFVESVANQCAFNDARETGQGRRSAHISVGA